MSAAATSIVIHPSEPGYESLPSLRSQNDPGYETVQLSPSAAAAAQTTRKPNSDYDPNYEVLRPAATRSNDEVAGPDDDMLYAKVWQHSAVTSQPSDDLNDGYSSIKSPTMNNNNSTQSSETVATASNLQHGYARISEATTNAIVQTTTDDTASDLYASITTIISPPNYLNVQQQNVSMTNNETTNTTTTTNTDDDHNYSTISETQSTALPATLSSSVYSNMSTDEPRTTPSSESNSSDTQIGYQSIRSGNDETTTSRSSRLMELSNYESLTGSESDPNYESVRYVDVDVAGGGAHENPYERLYNEAGGTTSPIEQQQQQQQLAGVARLTEGATNIPTVTSPSTSRGDGSMRQHFEVDDYFQV